MRCSHSHSNRTRNARDLGAIFSWLIDCEIDERVCKYYMTTECVSLAI